MEPSPTAEATRLTEPRRTSPAANTPGRLVSSGCGGRGSVQLAAGFPPSARSPPVTTNPCSSRPICGGSQSVCGTAPSVSHYHRHRAASGPQLPEAAESCSGGGFADDQVVLAVPVTRYAIERLEGVRVVVDRQQRRN